MTLLFAAIFIPVITGTIVYAIDRCVIVASVYGIGAEISYLMLVYAGKI